MTFGMTRKVQPRTENGEARIAHETAEAKKKTESGMKNNNENNREKEEKGAVKYDRDK